MTLYCPECHAKLINFDNDGGFCRPCNHYYPQHQLDCWIRTEIAEVQRFEDELYEQEHQEIEQAHQLAIVGNNTVNKLLYANTTLVEVIAVKNRIINKLGASLIAAVAYSCSTTGLLIYLLTA